MKKIVALLLAVLCLAALAACNTNGNAYTINNADRARHYDETYKRYVASCDEAEVVDNTLTGAAIVRLKDFTGEGMYELVIGYSSVKGGVVDRVMVYGFDNGPAKLYDAEIASKSSASAEGEALWIYTDNAGMSYIVKGEDLSKKCSYYTFKLTDDEGNKVCTFLEDFTTENGQALSGTYEKIEITNNSDTKAVLDENQKVLDSVKAQRN